MRIRTLMGTLVLSALLACPGWAQTMVEGAVESIDDASVQVAGVRYAITDATVCEDRAGGRIALSEIRAGTGVELEVETTGTVTLLRADLVR